MAAAVGHEMEVRFEVGIPAAYLFKWKVRPGSKVSQGTILLLYDERRPSEADVGRLKKMKATAVGTVSELLKTEGDAMHRGCPVLIMKGCSHPIVMKDMCAECGADLREFGCQPEQKGGKASVAMVHSIPELMVSQEQAQVLGKADEARLLKHKKLVLLVDLDQTLIHTTNDDVPVNLKDVHHFQLYGGHSPWYHARLRPGTKEFLEKISQRFELHICTFGARTYAHTIASFLDKDGRYFSHRILSRNECFNPNSKTANLSALFPCGDHLVCIIDDREDVWNFAPNLVHVKPYHFFQHTGDINAPPGLAKCDQDSEDKVKFFVGRKVKLMKRRSQHVKKQEEGSNKAKEDIGVDVEERTAKVPSTKADDGQSSESTNKAPFGKSSGISPIAVEDVDGGIVDSATKVPSKIVDGQLPESDVIESSATPLSATPECDADGGINDSATKVPSTNADDHLPESADFESSATSLSAAPKIGSEVTKDDSAESKQPLSAEVAKTPLMKSSPLQGGDIVTSSGLDVPPTIMDFCASSSTGNAATTILGSIEDQTPMDCNSTSELPSSEVAESPSTDSAAAQDAEDLPEKAANADSLALDSSEDQAPMDSNSTSELPSREVAEAQSDDSAAAQDKENFPEKAADANSSGLSENGVAGMGDKMTPDINDKNVAASKKTDAESSDQEENLVDVEDDDDYLLYLSEILENIHRAFYDSYAKQLAQQSGEIPDLKKVIPQVRRKVLRGVKMVFSGIIPTNVPVEKSRAYHVARSLGAEIQPNLVLRTKDNKHLATTHVVAARLGTIKVNEAKRCRGIHVITPDWLWCCADRWEWVSEHLFLLTKETAVDQKPAGVPDAAHSSRQRLPAVPAPGGPVQPQLEVFPTYDPVTGKRVHKAPAGIPKDLTAAPKDSLQAASSSSSSSSSASTSDAAPDFATSFNPLMSFSSEDIASMDQEVEDLLDSPDTDEEDVTVVADKDPPSSSSTSSCSLGAERPHGWGRTSRKRKMEDEEKDQDTESDDDRPKYPRCELPRDSMKSDSERDSDDFEDSVGSVDEEMAAAVEREFLGF